MRGTVTFSAAILVSIAVADPAVAEGVPDLTPLTCAWARLPPAEQTRLVDEFKVDLGDGFTLHFATANPAAAAEAATACQLNLPASQVEHLGLALARLAAEEKAKKGIAEKGEKPEAIATVLTKMHQGKRELIGNRYGCPGPHHSVGEWDESLRGAVRRANLRFKDQRAYAWVSLGAYAAMAKEGAVRRMSGVADACT